MSKYSIKSICNSPGGINVFSFLMKNDLGYLAKPINGKILAQALLAPNADDWNAVENIRGKISFKEEPFGVDSYSVSLSFFLVGSDYTNTDALEIINQKRMIVDFTDQNGIRRIIGNNEEFLKLSVDFNISDEVTTVTGHRLTFNGIFSHKSAIYAPV